MSHPTHEGSRCVFAIASMTMAMQFIAANAHPVNTMASNSITVDEIPASEKWNKNPRPSPRRRLNNGPAKHAVMAIEAPPVDLMAMLMFAMRSVREFPHARIVKPNMDGFMCPMMPNAWITPTISPATASIHMAAMAKPYMPIRAAPMGKPVPHDHSMGASMSPATKVLVQYQDMSAHALEAHSAARTDHQDGVNCVKYSRDHSGDRVHAVTNQDFSRHAASNIGIVPFKRYLRGSMAVSAAFESAFHRWNTAVLIFAGCSESVVASSGGANRTFFRLSPSI